MGLLSGNFFFHEFFNFYVALRSKGRLQLSSIEHTSFIGTSTWDDIWTPRGIYPFMFPGKRNDDHGGVLDLKRGAEC